MIISYAPKNNKMYQEKISYVYILLDKNKT